MQHSEKVEIFAVAGNPISHSLSPQMMNEAMGATKINGYYTRISAGTPEEIIHVMKNLRIKGCNITAPFKENIVRYLDLYDSRVQQTGCSNLILLKDDQFVGYNTDVNGIFQSLDEIEIDFLGQSALIVGYGGAARAAAYTLKMMHMQTYVTGKNPIKVEEFAQKTGCIPVDFENIQQAIDNAAIIISTIPKEAVLLHKATFFEQQVVLDCSYNNPTLEQKVTSRNGYYIDGKRWLLYQGAPSFKIFTDKDAPAETMFNALKKKAETPSVISVISSSENILGTISAHLIDFKECAFIDFAEDAKSSVRKLRKRLKKTESLIHVALILLDEMQYKDLYEFVSEETFSFWLFNDADLKKKFAPDIAEIIDVIFPTDGKTGAHIANHIRMEIKNMIAHE
ncbi:MAG: hypothetical protein LBH92_03760 [Bacteroidales bacterium]|jgi:shikimate dehydrogenase|nr:hypothetical protein [Bacteroidales bacterium]